MGAIKVVLWHAVGRFYLKTILKSIGLDPPRPYLRTLIGPMQNVSLL